MKLSLFSLYTTLFTLPFAIRKVFWRNEEGYFNEYTDVSLYLFEIFAALTVIILILEHKSDLKSIIKKYSSMFHVEHIILISLLVIPTAVFIFASKFVYPLFLLLKWMVYISFSLCFYYYLLKNVPRGTYVEKKCSTWNIFILSLVASMLIQAILIILQIVRQKSIGLYFLGEQVIDPVISGVSTIIINGSEYLRGYGTFLHPNIAAFFFLVYGIFLYTLIKIVPRGTNSSQNCSTWNNFSIFLNRMFHVEQLVYGSSCKNVPRGTLYSLLALLTLGLIFTFSKSVSVIALIIAVMFKIVPRGTNNIRRMFHVEQIVNKYKENVPRGTFLILVILFVGSTMYNSIDWGTYLHQSILERKLQYLSIPYTAFSHLILGHGLGSYTIFLAEKSPGLFSWQIQPIHNGFILVIYELGLLPVFSLITWLLWKGNAKAFFAKTVSNFYESYVMILLGSVLILFAVDHYMWDIEQGQFLLCIFLTLIFFLKNFLYQNTINRV